MNKPLIVILLLFSTIAQAQVYSDAKLWTAFSVTKKIDKFEFAASEELRFNENFTHIDKVFTELGASYEVIENLSVGFAYRYSRDNDYSEQAFDMSHRMDFGIDYKNKFQNFKWSIRNKIQTKPSDKYSRNPTYNRTKFTVKYDLDQDYEPYVYYEFYYQFNNEQIINRSRISIGAKYDFNKDNSIKAFYIFENRFNTEDLEHNHIWGVSYSLDL